jgi:hypothetical protein
MRKCRSLPAGAGATLNLANASRPKLRLGLGRRVEYSIPLKDSLARRFARRRDRSLLSSTL